MNTLHLTAAIQAYRAATAALPDFAPDDVMDAAIDREASALNDVRNSPCFTQADVVAKLAIVGELQADEEGGDYRAATLLAAIARDVYELRNAA